MNAAIFKVTLLMVAGAVMMAMGTLAAAESSTEIPAQFHGAGCNLKYAYEREPHADAMDCIEARVGRSEDGEFTNDDFVRITRNGVDGFYWGCSVETVTTVSATEFTFEADCVYGEQGNPYTIALLLRPGRQLIFHQIYEGRHLIEIYQLRDDLK